jgi:hypothetical protein
MPQYLVANYLPDNFDPSTVTEEMMEEIHALNREMIAYRDQGAHGRILDTGSRQSG